MKLNYINFKKILEKYNIFEKDPTIAVAVSGGPDSMGLLHLLNKWSKFVNGNIIALIVNHGLRKNSLEEAISIKNILEKANINSKILSVDKKKIKKENMNEARNNRYHLLTSYCQKKNLLHLFVAHHKNDNIETFLTRKVSGSDFEGLESMKFISTRNKTNIIRPLLDFSKTEILNYNLDNKIPFIIDPTNINLHYTRPSIRNFLQRTSKKNLKQIENEFLSIKKISHQYKSMIWEILINNITKASRSSLEFDFHNLLKLDELLLEKIIKNIYQYLYSTDYFLRSKKIHILIESIRSNNFKSFNLRGMIIKKINNSLIFVKKTN